LLDLPPNLLPLEAEQEFASFKTNVSKFSLRTINAKAFENFQQRLASAAAEGRQKVAAFEKALGWTRFLAFGKWRTLLGNLSYSLSPPILAPPGKDSLAASQKILRSTWGCNDSTKEQAIFSFYKLRGKTILQIGSGAFGFIYVTFPTSISPEEMAQELLGHLSKAVNSFVSQSGIVALYDGDHQKFNPKHVFPNHKIVRSVRNDPQMFLAKVSGVIESEAPSPANSSIQFGIPSTRSELAAVFKTSPADDEPEWGLWQSVSRNWRTRASNHGFVLDDQPASREATLEALAAKKNVIIVTAHARDRVIYLPAPPPEGSRIGPEDLNQYKDMITQNNPVVYLFCCEIADIDNLSTFATELLRCGARAVVAPQTQIDADKSASLFEALISESAKPETTLDRLLKAERMAGYREMEVWLG